MATIFPLSRLSARLLLVVIALSLSACTSLFFYPNKYRYHSPEKLGLVYEDVVLFSADGTKLSAWLLKTTHPRKGVIYYLHGNAENISSHIGNVYWLPEQGYDVFLLDYRGYGFSEGEPALPEVIRDIEAGLEWLTKYYSQQEPVFLLGQSIGAATGVYWLAHSPLAQERIGKTVLDSPFSSYPDIIEQVLQRSWVTWLFAKPISACFDSRYDPARAAPLLPAKMPVLVFHSVEDEVVPFVQGDALYKALPARKSRIVTTGGHIATFREETNREKLLEFLQQ